MTDPTERRVEYHVGALLAGQLSERAWDRFGKAVFLGSEPSHPLDGQHRLTAVVRDRYDLVVRDHDVTRVVELKSYGHSDRKQHTLASVLLRAFRCLDATRDAQQRAVFDRQLRASAEEFCGFPSITAEQERRGAASATRIDDAVLDDQAEAEAWAELARAAREELARCLAADVPALDHRPSGPESPCGVIRLAATRVPRAPGRQPAFGIPSVHGSKAA